MKNKILTILFILVIFGFGLLSTIMKDSEISSFERRKLASFPKFEKGFTEKLDDYLLDQFAFRNELINLNSSLNRKILNKIDNNDVYVIGDNIYEKNYPLNEEKTLKFTDKINYIINKIPETNRIYYSIIPDKSYFLEENKYLKLDYNQMYNIVKNNTNAKYIDITNVLNIDDYYKTDIHWKQENLSKVVKRVVENLGKECMQEEYIVKQYNNFYGASYSKAGLKLEPDILKCLYIPSFENVEVNHLEFGNKKIYDEEKLQNVDAYDIFLSGASSYIEITNNNLNDGSKLIIFRDSFASSLIPLLIPYYNNITVVDLRYIDFEYVKDKIDFNSSDVLFLYSTLIINNSNILKVRI